MLSTGSGTGWESIIGLKAGNPRCRYDMCPSGDVQLTWNASHVSEDVQQTARSWKRIPSGEID